MKKVLSVFAIIMVALVSLSFAGCQSKYSASSLKSNLEKNGYSVTENYDLVFDKDTDHEVKASQLSGIQKIFIASKGTGDDKEVAIILVFDSINNASNGVNSDRLVTLAQNAQYQCGDNKSASVKMGTFNNVAFAGTSACQDAAGLK